jgi:hypothetical protein
MHDACCMQPLGVQTILGVSLEQFNLHDWASAIGHPPRASAARVATPVTHALCEVARSTPSTQPAAATAGGLRRRVILHDGSRTVGKGYVCFLLQWRDTSRVLVRRVLMKRIRSTSRRLASLEPCFRGMASCQIR